MADAAVRLLSSQYTGAGWMLTDEELTFTNIADASNACARGADTLARSSPLVPCFESHSKLVLSDNPPNDGVRSTPVHRFVVKAGVAAALNAALRAHALASERSSEGVQVSNVGGFHSAESTFVRQPPHPAECEAWYAELLEAVLWPALGTLVDEPCTGDHVMSGWLNASGPRAFNKLHDHGADVLWSMVYFASDGSVDADAGGAGDARKGLPPDARGGSAAGEHRLARSWLVSRP